MTLRSLTIRSILRRILAKRNCTSFLSTPAPSTQKQMICVIAFYNCTAICRSCLTKLHFRLRKTSFTFKFLSRRTWSDRHKGLTAFIDSMCFRRRRALLGLRNSVLVRTSFRNMEFLQFYCSRRSIQYVNRFKQSHYNRSRYAQTLIFSDSALFFIYNILELD
jgi:hypothetical protein